MKKKAILLLLCITVLSGCGRVDSVEVDSQITPFEVEQTTDENDEHSGAVTISPLVTAATTVASGSDDTVTTTAKTGAVNLVRRTGVVKNTVTPSRNTVRVPSRSTAIRNTTATASSTTTVPATTIASTTAITTELTTIDNQNPTVVSRDNMLCQVTESGISVMINEEPVQNISIDTSYMLNSYSNGNIDPKYCVNICDLNFDGNYDLFVPQSEDEHNVFGKFLRYNPETMLFEEWEALSGITTYTSSSEENQTITSIVKTDDKQFEENTYQWSSADGQTGNQLNVISTIKQYLSPDNPNMANKDYYKYVDNVAIIEKRQILTFHENGEITVEDISTEWLT